MKQLVMAYVLALFLVLLANSALPQQVYSTNPDSATLFPTTHGTFENYVFILNGGPIEHHALAAYPEARLDRIFSYKRENRQQRGVVYFSTPWYPPPPPQAYDNDPAYFINGIQVSPYAIRASNPEAYKGIRRSVQDTVINGTQYNGAVHVDTDEDFFAERIALPEVIEKYTGLPIDRVIVHLRGRYTDALNAGAIIHEQFHLYYTNPKNLRAVEVDRLRLADGDRYVVHVVDERYRWPHPRTYWLFKDIATIDPAGPCYLADFDTTRVKIYHRAEAEPQPQPGVQAYLIKLSAIMGLPAVKGNDATTPDSVTVRFVVLGNGQITGIESNGPANLQHERIKRAIKQHSCVWPVAANNGRPVLFRRTMTIVYSRDKSGSILSLNGLQFKYDNE